MELEIHLQMEASYIYDVFQRISTEEPELAILTDCKEDHRRFEDQLWELRRAPEGTLDYYAKIADLIEDVSLHFEREERDLYPMIQFRVGPILEEMGEPFLLERSRLLNLAQYQDAKPEEVQNPRGGEQMKIRKIA